jgi:hypothetical protein
MLAAAQQSLRSAGIRGNETTALLEHLAQKAIREVMKGIRLPLPHLPADVPYELGVHFMTALQEREPALASFIQRESEASAKLVSDAWKNATAGA